MASENFRPNLPMLCYTVHYQPAGVAQLVEQLICNQPVASSSLVTSLLNSLI
jgi:hypothetical protein